MSKSYISKIVKEMPDSGIKDFFDVANTLDGALSLGVGEPDFITPEHVRNAAIASIEKGETKYTEDVYKRQVEWLLANADPYDSTPGAANTFQWVLKESAYADYDKNNVVIDGTVTIQNKDYTPVSISGPDVEITYDGSHTLDVSKYFTIDANAGAPTYELLGTSTGTGTLNDTTLTKMCIRDRSKCVWWDTGSICELHCIRRRTDLPA